MQSSFYSLAQLTTAFAWGMVSDRYGRKQLIVMSNFFSTISMLMFGLAGNYTLAAISRVIGGWYVHGPLRVPQAFLVSQQIMEIAQGDEILALLSP